MQTDMEGTRAPGHLPLAVLAQVGLLIGLLAWIFGPTWVWAAEIWRKSEYYGHGFLILPISAYLAWRLWRTRPAVGGTRWPGLPLMAAGLALHVLARRYDVWFPSGFGFLMVVGGLVWWLAGTATARHFWFPIAFLAFAVPLERILVLQFAQPLQLGSSTVAEKILKAAGMPVTQLGTTLKTTGYTFEVAIPCSGLRSSIAMSALAALMAYLAAGRTWARLVVFAAGVPVALAANACRIVLTLVLATAISPVLADGFFHTASGLVVFGIAVAGLLVIARLVGCGRMRTDI